MEFAMISPALMLLMMAAVEMGMMLTAQVLMESATFSASRTGKTGYIASGQTQEQTIKAEITRIGRQLMNPAAITVTSFAYNNYANIGQPEPFVDANNNGRRDSGETFNDVNGNGAYDLDQGESGYGGAGEIVVYTSTYNWTFFTPLVGRFFGSDRAVNITASAVVKNEPEA